MVVGMLGKEGMVGSGGKLTLGTLGMVGKLGIGGRAAGIVGIDGCGNVGKLGICWRLRAAKAPWMFNSDKAMNKANMKDLQEAILSKKKKGC
ncbi:hypothetical protein Pint_31235 [Pistacia integerrima]|uniref:Uncharacterized protein n=1 Tax=Pistacia integerrima TaxID=434235 RepID=A0ACC0XPF2_9ROSI|nr:hypothetical protein Pint_31235 [Pistacia integerrima]